MLAIEAFTPKYDFLHFWTDECSLKRAIGSNSGHCTLTGTLKRTGKRTARLGARLSVQPF